MHEFFRKAAHRVSCAIGSPFAFAFAMLGVIVWAICGPVFGFSDTWQLVINTSTTIITFLVVFMIQNTQNRDSRALHLKIDELLRALATARNGIIDIEELPDDQLLQLEQEFRAARLAPDRDPAEQVGNAPAASTDPREATQRPVRGGRSHNVRSVRRRPRNRANARISAR